MEQCVVGFLAHITRVDVGTAGEQQRIDVRQCLYKRFALGVWRDEQGHSTGDEHRAIIGLCKRGLAIGKVCCYTYHGTVATKRIAAMKGAELTAYIKFIY